jgi:hypothetical protein
MPDVWATPRGNTMHATEEELKTLKSLPLKTLKKAFCHFDEGHDMIIHMWKSLRDTGLKPGCLRCEWLMEIDLRERQRLLGPKVKL